MLADYGQIELLWSTEPEAGIKLAYQHRPNLILLDLHLGGKDGGEVLRRLKQDDQTANIPVVMVSADATPDQIERLLALGARLPHQTTGYKTLYSTYRRVADEKEG